MAGQVSWDQIVRSDHYQQLDEKSRSTLEDRFFEANVAPRIDQKHHGLARERMRAYTPARVQGDVVRDIGATAGKAGVSAGQGLWELADAASELSSLAFGGIRGLTTLAKTGDMQAAKDAWLDVKGIDEFTRSLSADGRSVSERLNQYREFYDDVASDTTRIKQQQLAQAGGDADDLAGNVKGYVDALSYLAKNPDLLAMIGAESAGQYLIGAGVAGKVGNRAFRATKERLMKQGLDEKIATAKARVEAIKQGGAASMLVEGATEGGFSGAEAGSIIMDLPDEALQKAPAFQELIAAGKTPQQAKQALAREANSYATGIAAAVSMASSKIVGSERLKARIFSGIPTGPDNIAKRVLKSTAVEGLQESVQEGGAQFATNVGVQQTGQPDRGWGQGVGGAAGTGAAAGGVMGAGAGLLSRRGDIEPVDEIDQAIADVAERRAPPSRVGGSNPSSIITPESDGEPTTADVLDSDAEAMLFGDESAAGSVDGVPTPDEATAQGTEPSPGIATPEPPDSVSPAKQQEQAPAQGASSLEGDEASADAIDGRTFVDPRLRRPEHRGRLQAMAGELQRGGDVQFLNERELPVNANKAVGDGMESRTTPSVNPPWFQALAAETEFKGSVSDYQRAVAKALSGERLGVRQERIVRAMLDEVTGERTDYAKSVREQMERARELRKGIRRDGYDNPSNYFEEADYDDHMDVDRRTLYEMVEQANAFDPDETDRVLDVGEDVSDYAIAEQLAEIINRGQNETSQALDADDESARARGDEYRADAPGETAGQQSARAQTQGAEDSRRSGKPELTSVDDLANEALAPGAGADQPPSPGRRDATGPGVRTGSEVSGQPGPDEDNAGPGGRAPRANVSGSGKSDPDEITTAANEAATSPANALPEPTEAQKEAGNYKVGRVRVHGLDISIENPRGSTRRGTDPGGNAWEQALSDHYGYIRGTVGRDKDHVDVFVADNPEASARVYVVDQVNPDGSFDEHKVMLGYPDKIKALQAYRRNYARGWKGMGEITGMSVDKFREWLKSGDTTKPVALANPGKPEATAPKKKSRAKADKEWLDAKQKQLGVWLDDVVTFSRDIGYVRAGRQHLVESVGKSGIRVKNLDRGTGTSLSWRELRLAVERGTKIDRSEGLTTQSNADLQAKDAQTAAAAPRQLEADNPENFALQPQTMTQEQSDATAEAGVKANQTDMLGIKADDVQNPATARDVDPGVGGGLFAGAASPREQIQAWIDGKLASNVIINIAHKGDVFERVGIKPGPFALKQSVLKKARERHGLSDEALLSIPDGVATPLAIFDDPDIAGTRVLVTRVQSAGENVIAAARIGEDGATINDIRSVHPKRGESIRRWIDDGLLLAVENDEGRKWLDNSAGTNPLQSPAKAANALMIFDRFGRVQSESPAKPTGGDAARTGKEQGGARSGPEQKIEDFGDELAGARKHAYSAAYRDEADKSKSVDLAAVPLSQSFPAPDYQKLLGDGVSEDVVALVRALRDDVPAKPRTRTRLRAWSRAAESIRDLAYSLLDGSMTPDSVRSELRAPGFSRNFTHISGRADLYLAVGHEHSLKGVRIQVGDYSIYKGEAFDPPKTVWTVQKAAKATAFSNWPRELASGNTRESAIEDFRNNVDRLTGGTADTKRVRFNIYQDRLSKEFYIGKKAGKTAIRLKLFDTVKAARAYLADPENQAELERLLKQAKYVPPVRGKSNSPRIGKDHRDGVDVTAEMFANTFGFRGVQFGNWVEQSRRQADLNDAYDALMDMAAVLDLPARALSLNGELGLAFGARGRGGAQAAAAHYERGTVAINLTKRAGPGSLAHEWWHALDNYFSRMRGKPDDYLTSGQSPEQDDAIRMEMKAAFDGIVSTIQRSKLPARSRELDKTRSTQYWSTKVEMTARSFESYIIAKLADQNGANDYLANVVSEEVFAAAGDKAYPYPTEQEMTGVRRAYDRFFSVVETRETDQGVAMYSRAQARLTGRGKGRVTEGSKRLAQHIQRWQGVSADEGKVVEVALPDAVPARRFLDATGKRVVVFRSEHPAYEFNGAVFPGDPDTLYVNEASEYPIDAVVGHELTHALKPDEPDLYARLEQAALDHLADAPGDYANWLRNEAAKADADMTDAQVMEEVVSDYVGSQFRTRRLWQRLYDQDASLAKRLANWVRDWLTKFLDGFKGKRLKGTVYVRDVETMRKTVDDVLREYEGRKASGSRSGATALDSPIFKTRASGVDVSRLFARFHTDKPASFTRVVDGVREVMGLSVDVPIVFRDDPDPAAAPMYFDGDAGVIAVNRSRVENPSKAASYLVEEYLHALDAAFGGRSIAAGSPRFAPGGDLFDEAGSVTDGDYKRFLKYPLDEPMNQGETAAELFARLGALYHGNQPLFRQHFPEAARYYDAISFTIRAQRERSDDSVSGQVWGAAAEARDHGRGDQRGVGGSGEDLFAGDRGWKSDTGLGAIQKALARRGNANVLGRKVTRRLRTQETPPSAGSSDSGAEKIQDQTRTEAFRRWFGNSQVVDEDGEPWVVYKAMHPFDYTKEVSEGRGAHRRVIDPGPVIDVIQRPTPHPAFNGDEHGVKIAGFFGDKKTANRFTGGSKNSAIYPVYLSLQNPFVIEADGRNAGDIQFGESGREFREAVRSGGYDGVIIRNTKDEGTVYVAFRPEQIKSAIGNRGTFDPNDARIGYSRMSKRRSDDPAMRESMRKAGTLGAELPLGERLTAGVSAIWEQAKTFGREFQSGTFDAFRAIRDAEGNIDPERSGYIAARLSTGASSVMYGAMLYGTPEWRGGMVTRKPKSKGLTKVLEPVSDDINAFISWMVAKRAEYLASEAGGYRENNLTLEDIGRLKSLAGDREAEYEAVAAEFRDFNTAMLELARDGGLLSQAQVDAFSSDAYYVPFYRQDDDGDVTRPFTNRGLSHQSAGVRQLKGGAQALNDPLENVFANMARLIDASMKNHALYRTLMSNPQIATRASMSRNAGKKDRVVQVMNRGKPYKFEIRDPAMFRALTAIGQESRTGHAIEFGRWTKRLLTTGVTAEPTFMLRNFIRDMMHSWTIDKNGFRFAMDSARGVSATVRTMREAAGDPENADPVVMSMMFAGASFLGGYVYGTDPAKNAAALRRSLRRKGMSASKADAYMGSLVSTPAEFWAKYRDFGDAVENANRVAVAKAALAAGKSELEAVFDAKDLMDYSLRGQWAAIQVMADVLPFFNARLQGMYKLGREMVREPGADTYKKIAANLTGQIARKGAWIALASIVLAAVNEDDDDYQALEDWDKDANWHLFLGGTHIRIPKPFELGILFGTVPERLWMLGRGQNDLNDSGRALAHALTTTLAINPIPQAVRPGAEVFFNWDMFRERPVEGMADQGKLPEDRYSSYTSPTMVAIGKQLGLSPKKLEHIWNGHLGTLGGYALSIPDTMFRWSQPGETPDIGVGDLPVLGSFVKTGPAWSTRYGTEMYKMSRDAEQIYRSLRDRAEKGEDWESLQEDPDNLRLLMGRDALRYARQAVSGLRKQKDVIRADTTLSGAEKKQQLDDIQRRINELQKTVVEKMENQ